MGNFYRDHAVMARVVFIPVALVSGLVKGLLFPIITTIQTLIFSIIAIVRIIQRKNDDAHYWQAAALSFVGASTCVVFFVLSAYYLPISAASGIYMTGVAISVTVHIYRACRGPVVPIEPHEPHEREPLLGGNGAGPEGVPHPHAD